MLSSRADKLGIKTKIVILPKLRNKAPQETENPSRSANFQQKFDRVFFVSFCPRCLLYAKGANKSASTAAKERVRKGRSKAWPDQS